MQIAIASGKGGTGKTTLATNLAYYLSQKQNNVALLDCDVEEPNGHIFIKPDWQSRTECYLPVPEIDEEKCTACGICSRACQFSAIATIKDTVLTFPELCHGCGLCMLICPEKAITEGSREIGIVETGFKGDLKFVHGKLRVGEAMSPPLIKEVKKFVSPRDITIIDAPPGTSCPVISALAGSDLVLLVTEPTPFGLNDLKLAVEMVKELEIPMAIIINRADIGDRKVWDYCKKEDIPIIAEIPHNREVAQNYSKGCLLLDSLPEFKNYFKKVGLWIEKELGK